MCKKAYNGWNSPEKNTAAMNYTIPTLSRGLIKWQGTKTRFFSGAMTCYALFNFY
jgi:hypothetical protein